MHLQHRGQDTPAAGGAASRSTADRHPSGSSGTCWSTAACRAPIELGWSGRGSNHITPLFISTPEVRQHHAAAHRGQQRRGHRHHRALLRRKPSGAWCSSRRPSARRRQGRPAARHRRSSSRAPRRQPCRVGAPPIRRTPPSDPARASWSARRSARPPVAACGRARAPPSPADMRAWQSRKSWADSTPPIAFTSAAMLAAISPS